MNYKDIIESRYNREAWQQLLHDIFLSKVVFRTPYEVKVNSRFAKGALKLGTITLSDEQQLAIYEVELSDKVDIERNKRGIRDMLTADWRRMGYAGAFMFCYRKTRAYCVSLMSVKHGDSTRKVIMRSCLLIQSDTLIFLVKDAGAVPPLNSLVH